jgi:hypothetical protein
MLDDALGNAKDENRWKVASKGAMNVSRQGSTLLKSSSAQRWHTLSPTVNVARTFPRFVHMATGAESKGANRGDCGMPVVSSAQEHQPSSLVVTMVVIAQPSDHTTAWGNSNSKFSKPGEISGVLNELIVWYKKAIMNLTWVQTSSQHSPLQNINLPQALFGCSPK